MSEDTLNIVASNLTLAYCSINPKAVTHENKPMAEQLKNNAIHTNILGVFNAFKNDLQKSRKAE